MEKIWKIRKSSKKIGKNHPESKHLLTDLLYIRKKEKKKKTACISGAPAWGGHSSGLQALEGDPGTRSVVERVDDCKWQNCARLAGDQRGSGGAT